MSTKILLINVKNPQQYIDRQTNSFKRKNMQTNLKMCGTPIGISTNGLKISFDRLVNIVNENFEKYKND